MAAGLMAALAPLMIQGTTRGVQAIRRNRKEHGNIRERRAARREPERPQATPEQLEAARHSPYRQNEHDMAATGYLPQNAEQWGGAPAYEEEVIYEPPAYGFEGGYPENPYDMPPEYEKPDEYGYETYADGGEVDEDGYELGGFAPEDGMAHTMFHPESASLAMGGYADGGILPYATGGYAPGGYRAGGMPHYGLGGFLKDASSGIFNSLKGLGQKAAPQLIERGKSMGQGLLNKGAEWAGNKAGEFVGNKFGQEYGDMARQGLSQGINQFGNRGLEAAGGAANRFAEQGFQRAPQQGAGMQKPMQQMQQPQRGGQQQGGLYGQQQQGGMYGQQQQPMVRPGSPYGNQYASIYG
jgi:hypothetical protein